MASGLVNLRNTCFLASVVQCLQHIPALNMYLKKQHACSKDSERSCIVCMMAELAEQCFSSVEPVEPKELANNLQAIAPHLMRGRQEDAHEFLHSLLNRMQEDLIHNITPKPDQYVEMTTPIGQIFGGFLRSQIVCLGCNRASNSYESLLSISLEIKSARSLKEALDSFVSPEDMGAEEWYSCDTCKTKQKAVKSYSIDTPPRVLIIHLKRYNQEERYQSKLSHRVDFDELLNLEPYISRERAREEKVTTYDLSSVLIHLGNHIGAGHYYSYVADPGKFSRYSKKSWHMMNDDAVTLTTSERVKDSEAYLLFYVRSDCRPKNLINDCPRPFLVKTDLNRQQPPQPTTLLDPADPDPSPLPMVASECHPQSDDISRSPGTLKTGLENCNLSPSLLSREVGCRGDECQQKCVPLQEIGERKNSLPENNSDGTALNKRKPGGIYPIFERSFKRQKTYDESSTKIERDLPSTDVKSAKKTEGLGDTSVGKIVNLGVGNRHKVEGNAAVPLRRHYSDLSHYHRKERSRSRNRSRDPRHHRSNSRLKRRASRSHSRTRRSRGRYERSRSRERSRGRTGRSRSREYRKSRYWNSSTGVFQWNRTYARREPSVRTRWRHRRSPNNSPESDKRHRSREKKDRRDEPKRHRDRRSRS